MATKKRSTTRTAVEIGAGALAAAAAAGAGYYFYGDKNAKKHRKAASAWAKGMKRDVMKEARALKRLDEKAMARVVDRAAALYQGVRSVDRKDLRQAANELKRNWHEVKREVAGRTAGARKAMKRAKTPKRRPAKARKAAPKKIAKKAAKKRSR